MKSSVWLLVCGTAAGVLSGLLGTGGGMALVMMLPYIPEYQGDNLFPACVCIMLPVCITGTVVFYVTGNLIYMNALPYLIGSAVGGLAAGLWGRKIPNIWLHRLFGILIIAGGIRQLWQYLK